MNGGRPLEEYFSRFRANIIGQGHYFDTPSGRRQILYADWTASGRAYRPIEARLLEDVLPFFGNTHTETTVTGTRTTFLYDAARRTIKEHVRAGAGDQLIFCGSGMTAAVNKLQRILGLRWSDQGIAGMKEADFPAGLDEEVRPVIFVTHMEHHSNHVSWLETIATVEIIRPDGGGGVDLRYLGDLLERYRRRRVKIAAVTACSNVTGIETPYREIAKLMHAHGGWCFVDFAASAPYVEIDMHPAEDKGADLDAIYLSVHKFLGGPGTPGVLIFHRRLYHRAVPDHPGGGTLQYSNPWGGRDYVEEIELREDGGTPPILQGIKAGLCIRLKEEMGTAAMLEQESTLVRLLLGRLSEIPGVSILAEGKWERLGIISFIIEGTHYQLVVKLLNDRFGIQARGGCSCAGTYGHFLLDIDQRRSAGIRAALTAGDLRSKPGWVRLSVHPTMTAAEMHFIADAVRMVAARYGEWCGDYVLDRGGGIRNTCPVDRI